MKTTTSAASSATTPKTSRAIDFEAPITITLSGRLAATFRFIAYIDGRAAEEVAIEALEQRAVSEITDGFSLDGPTTALDWITGK